KRDSRCTRQNKAINHEANAPGPAGSLEFGGVCRGCKVHETGSCRSAELAIAYTMADGDSPRLTFQERVVEGLWRCRTGSVRRPRHGQQSDAACRNRAAGGSPCFCESYISWTVSGAGCRFGCDTAAALSEPADERCDHHTQRGYAERFQHPVHSE